MTETYDFRVYVYMQNLNRKTVEWHALPERSRFYQSAIDMITLIKMSLAAKS